MLRILHKDYIVYIFLANSHHISLGLLMQPLWTEAIAF